jgi:hypothetical protein
MSKYIQFLILLLIGLNTQANDIIFNWQAGKGYFPFQARKTKNKDVSIKQLKNVDGHNCCSIYDNTKDGSAVLSYKYPLIKARETTWKSNYTVSVLCRVGNKINPPTGADLFVLQCNNKNLLMLRLDGRRTLWLGMKAHLSGNKKQHRIVDKATGKEYRLPVGKWVLIQVKRLAGTKLHIFINKRDMGEYDSLEPLSAPMTKLTIRSLIRGKAQVQWAAVCIADSKYDKSIAQGNWPAMENVIKNPKDRVLSFNLDKVKKDLKDSIQGVDAESHATCANYKILLGDLKQDFSKLLKASGRPVLRMMDHSRYSWRSAKVNDILRKYPTGKSENFWYSPKQFHKFCKDNNIKLIGYFDTKFAYNEKTGKRVQIYDTPENFKTGVEENMRKLKWVIDNGYLDLYTCWEVGSENYCPWKNPEQYAKYALMIASAAKKLDPKIRLAVDVFVCAPDDPNLNQYLGKGEKLRDKWYRWSEKMLATLGNDAKKFYYINIHLYGASSSYNANYQGIHTHLALLKKFPATKHMRFIVTEWRHTGVGDRNHRQFKTAALWKAKFTLVLAAYPLVDYTSVHDFLTWSGVGYYSDGKVWFRQGEVPKAPKVKELFKCKSGKPSLDIGIFAPVLKMTNNIIRNYPLLLVHKADLGNNSSTLFASTQKEGNSSDSINGIGRDLEWFICTDRAKNKIGALIVNTQAFPVKVTLKRQNGKVWKVNKAQALTCEADKIFKFEVPGEKKFWQLAPFKPNPDGSATIPSMSVVSLEVK